MEERGQKILEMLHSGDREMQMLGIQLAFEMEESWCLSHMLEARIYKGGSKWDAWVKPGKNLVIIESPIRGWACCKLYKDPQTELPLGLFTGYKVNVL